MTFSLPGALGRYSKIAVALVGAVVIILGRHLGLDSPVYADVTAILTAAGVYGVTNA